MLSAQVMEEAEDHEVLQLVTAPMGSVLDVVDLKKPPGGASGGRAPPSPGNERLAEGRGTLRVVLVVIPGLGEALDQRKERHPRWKRRTAPLPPRLRLCVRPRHRLRPLRPLGPRD